MYLFKNMYIFLTKTTICQTKTIDLNHNKPLYIPFRLNLDKYNESCNTIHDPYARLCVSNKTSDVNLKLVDITANKSEQKLLMKQVSCGCRCRLDGNILKMIEQQ